MSATTDTDYTMMRRAFDLAIRGLGNVSPNPPVGAVVVYNGQILGEGFHTRYGAPHAEVEAIASVPESMRHLLPEATLYVTLEPCCHTGKTPPCSDLILREGIKDVRISIIDPHPLVAGKGIETLRSAGVNVKVGILENEGRMLLRAFTTGVTDGRPRIMLKWAQSRFGITGVSSQQIWLSEPATRTWVHRQRAEADAIMVGAGTVLTDNPSLTARDFPGKSPQRIIFDPHGRLHDTYTVFDDDGVPVWYFSQTHNSGIHQTHVRCELIPDDTQMLRSILTTLYATGIRSLIVEGGSRLHRLFVEADVWDEAWIIQTQHPLSKGIEAPSIYGERIFEIDSGTDRIIGIQKEMKKRRSQS
jgi:diaminohydroxyphosphoribosylaminopyrimidine deaminase/5-amino-6-(5-phosphoribosylamino)uracil reductase